MPIEYDVMARSFLPYGPDQIFLLPPCPYDWLPEDHLAYQVIEVVGELDMSPFLSNYSTDGRGAPAFSPSMMVGVVLYSWIHHTYSSRKVELLCHQDVGARVICGGSVPDHRTINRFRTQHDDVLKLLFHQSVHLCMKAGMVSMAEAALDGTKIAANASKRKAMSYAHLVASEERIQAEIDGYFRRASEEDAAEDALLGPDKTGHELPEHLRRRQDRLVKIRAAKVALEAEAQAAAQAKEKERAAKVAAAGGKIGGKAPKIDPIPKSTAQRCFTDPESRIMKSGNGAFIQGYNGQVMVDGAHQVIIGCALTQAAGDVGQLAPMVRETIKQTGIKPGVVMADGGYFSAANLQEMEDQDVSILIPPDKERCGTPDNPAEPLSPEALAALSPKERMRHLVSTKEGREAYSHRKTTVEPVFGQIKGSTGNPGFTGFLRRGFEKCDNEWHLICARHNILKYIRFKLANRAKAAPKTTVIPAKAAVQSAKQLELVAA